MPDDRRRELEAILQSVALRTDAQHGDADARRILDQAAAELLAIEHRQRREAAA